MPKSVSQSGMLNFDCILHHCCLTSWIACSAGFWSGPQGEKSWLLIWWSLRTFWKVVCLPTWTDAPSMVECSGTPQSLKKVLEGISNTLIIGFGNMMSRIKSGFVTEDLATNIPSEGFLLKTWSVCCKSCIQSFTKMLLVRPMSSAKGENCMPGALESPMLHFPPTGMTHSFVSGEKEP